MSQQGQLIQLQGDPGTIVTLSGRPRAEFFGVIRVAVTRSKWGA
jgi:hypothetical protein